MRRRINGDRLRLLVSADGADMRLFARRGAGRGCRFHPLAPGVSFGGDGVAVVDAAARTDAVIAVTFLGAGRGSSRLHLAPVVTEGGDGLLVAVAAAGTGVFHLAGRDARHTLRLFALVIMPQSRNFHRLAACFRIAYRAVSNFFIRARRSAGRGNFVFLDRLARRMPEGCHFHRLAAHFLSAAPTNRWRARAACGAARS